MMRLLLRRGLRRQPSSASSSSSSCNREQTWENTRSCPGSFRCHRREPAPVLPTINELKSSLQRHNSDPGSLKARSPSPVATALFKRQFTTDSLVGSVAIDMHGAESKWSLYKPSAHWDEVFEPGRDTQFHADANEDHSFGLKQLLNTGRPRSRLRCLALIFAIVYLAYAFYVTISRVNRTCKPISGLKSASTTTVTAAPNKLGPV